MGILQHRARIASRTPEGGGLTEESLTDTATDGDIMDHQLGDDPAGVAAVAELDYDDEYGPVGTPDDRPIPDPYTIEEARKDASGYDATSFAHAQEVRNVAEMWEAKSVTFAAVGAGAPPDAYPLAGQDQRRKRLIIRNVSVASVSVLGCDIAVGSDASVNRFNGFILHGGYSIAGDSMRGETLVVEHSGDVWIVPAVYPAIAGEAITVSYAVERYAQ